MLILHKTCKKSTMNHYLILIPTIFSILCSCSSPRQIIFDTDWWTDVDDACAVRLLLDAERRGGIDLLGICLSAINATSVESLDAFLLHEGRQGLPIGADKDATDYTGNPCYHQLIIDNSNGAPLRDISDSEDCVSFYRRLLAGAKGKVDIVAVGYPNALAKLLSSPADDISRMDGKTLVRKKVAHLWMMAGNYPEGRENNFCRTERSRLAGAEICEEWPGEITFLGYEVGIQVVAGGNLPECDLLHKVLAVHGSANGRYAWDPLTTLMGISGSPGNEGFREIKGMNIVDSGTGSNHFEPSADGRHSYVVMTMLPEWYVERLNRMLDMKK